MKYTNETLLLFPRTVHFREAYPEHIRQWERQIASDACAPDLYFCMVALDDYPSLKGYLNSREYLIDFVVNAHILYDSLVSRLVVNGHDENLAVEIANQELRSVYRSRNDSTEIMEDRLATVHFELLDNEDKVVDAEYYF
jgi:hypothetical protein